MVTSAVGGLTGRHTHSFMDLGGARFIQEAGCGAGLPREGRIWDWAEVGGRGLLFITKTSI